MNYLIRTIIISFCIITITECTPPKLEEAKLIKLNIDEFGVKNFMGLEILKRNDTYVLTGNMNCDNEYSFNLKIRLSRYVFDENQTLVIDNEKYGYFSIDSSGKQIAFEMPEVCKLKTERIIQFFNSADLISIRILDNCTLFYFTKNDVVVYCDDLNNQSFSNQKLYTGLDNGWSYHYDEYGNYEF